MTKLPTAPRFTAPPRGHPLEDGRSASPSGHSAEPEPISVVSAETASVPNAADLAARCEAATGPDDALDWTIAEAIGCAPGLAYTASLDAAMTLVPKGWGYSICPRSVLLTRSVNDVGVMGRAPTPALALCAAALRAQGAA